jgi:cell division protein FtsW
MGAGLVQVYSSSYIFATESFGDGLYFFNRQLLFSGVALVGMIATAQMPLKWIEKWGWALWVGASLGVLVTFVPGLSVKVGGAARWIQLPLGIRLEPSEILKFSFSFLFAALLVREENALGKLRWWALLPLVAVPLMLLLKQPDFGSFAIIVCVSLGLLFAFGLKRRYIFAAVSVVLPAFYFLVMRVPYRRARVLAFLDPWSDPEQKGFQVIQSMLSFHSGGMTGSGLGQGQGKLFFLPEAHTDFTLAVLGEELGFVGFTILLSLYLFVILRGFQISLKCERPFFRALSIGIIMTFALSIFINAGVVMGLLPTKGLTLPFFSYGGSSLVTLCLMLGVLLNIERNINDNSLGQAQNPFFRRQTRLN